MARTVISDDLKYIKNKYELNMLTVQRVRDLNGGEEPVITVAANQKPIVTALREIATGKLDIDELRTEFIQSYKKVPVVDEESSEVLETKEIKPELKGLDEELAGVSTIKQEVQEKEVQAQELEE